MKFSTALLASAVCSTLFASPALAADDQTNTFAPEAVAKVEKAPDNYDPKLKTQASEKFKTSGGTPSIVNGNPVVVLDPGHGGSDPGGVGNGLYEKNLTLDIALRSRSYIWSNYPMWCYMTRESDVDKSLNERTAYANDLNADFFVSYHINSYSGTTPSGLETYYYPGAADGQSLATNLYNQLKSSYSVLRGIKSADYYVLHYTNMAAALGETGFISNPTDAANLSNATFRQTLAVQYAQGIHIYWWGY